MSGPGYASPILDAIAERAIVVFRGTGSHGRTVAELAAGTEANPRTVRSVLKGAPARFGSEPFERCADLVWGTGFWQRRQAWRLRASWSERAS